jgi:cytochrome c oxidase subunit 4/cytochrome o ubiquinol oxidase operon protein cyoD
MANKIASTHDTHAHEAHSHSNRIYWVMFVILAVLTAVEVAIFELNKNGIVPKTLEVILLLILSFGKGIIVVMYYMHLKGDAGVFKFLFVVPFLMASGMLLSFLLIFSQHVGIAG